MGSVFILNRAAREGLIEKVTLKQIRLKLGKGANPMEKGEKSTVRGGHGQCKGPEAGVLSVAREGQMRGSQSEMRSEEARP